MEKKKINEGNKLIAECLGYEYGWFIGGEKKEKQWIHWKNDTKIKYTRDLKYHSSWYWFVPAFNKIQKMKHDKEFCDLILAYVRHNDHENAFKTLVNYVNIVIYNKPIKVNVAGLKDLKKHL